METRKGNFKSLKVLRTPYIELLKQDLPHRNYFDSFLCSQTPEISEDGPTRTDIKLSKSNLKFNLPYPISEPVAKAPVKDPCFELTNKKQAFLSQVECAKKKYQYDKGWLTQDKILNDKVKFIPKYLYELTNGKSADPDPYFKSGYDFYYTGGNLCRIRGDDEAAVIYPDNTGNITCTNIKTTETTPLINFGGDTVYNIKSCRDKYLTVRQKHEISVVRVKHKRGKYKAKQLWNISSPVVPFSDCELLDDNEMCYTDMEKQLRILDVEREMYKHEHTLYKNEGDDELMQVKYLDANVVSIMGRHNVSLYDQRSATCSLHSSEELLFKCNHYCAFCRSSRSDNYLYVATKHNVLKFDLRKRGVVKKWTHLMPLDPNVVKAARYNDEEIVCASGFLESVCFSAGDENYMPLRLMNARTAFDECRLKKKFVFRKGLEGRFGMGTVGVEFLENNSDFAIFLCNSIGDVFRHNLDTQFKTEAANVDVFTSWMLSHPDTENSHFTQNPACNNNVAMDEFISWVDSVPEFAHPLSATGVTNMKSAKKLLLRKETGNLEETARDEKVPSLEPLMEYLDRYSEHNFSNIWSSGTPMDIDDDLTTMTSQNKVSDWLVSTSHNEND